jgi:hypothetical protein
MAINNQGEIWVIGGQDFLETVQNEIHESEDEESKED